MLHQINDFGLNTMTLVKSMSRQSKLQENEVKIEKSLVKLVKLKK